MELKRMTGKTTYTGRPLEVYNGLLSFKGFETTVGGVF